MIKAAFFDIDGTTVSFNTHVISDTTLQSLDRLRSDGTKLFIASGRHLHLINNLKDYPFDGYICMNGALVYLDGEIIYRHPMDSGDAASIIQTVTENSVPSIVYREDNIYMSAFNDVARRVMQELDIPEPTPADLREAVKAPVYQITPFFDAKAEKELLLPCIKESVVARWHPEFVDVNPLGISKAVAIEAIISRLEIAREETIAFGDGGNDIEMLKYAGIGVAMGNAGDNVKANADYVTSSVDEEGITAALRHFGLIK